MSTGFVLFRLAAQTFATPLDEVREIVRLEGLEPLPGARPPLAGVVVLRGAPLPVLDVRGGTGSAAERGDILVLDVGADAVGVAVDRVVAVLAPDELPVGTAPARALPAYVVGVHHHGGAPVLLVDLHGLLDVTSTGWVDALGADALA